MVIRCKKSQHRPLIAEKTDPKDGLGSVIIYIFTLELEALYKTATRLFILLHNHQETLMPISH